MNTLLKIALVLFSLFLGSCGGPGEQKLTILADPGDKGKVLLFDKEKEHPIAGEVDSFFLRPGRHEYSFGEEEQQFNMPDKGALLNLSGRELVLVNIIFEAEKEEDKFPGAVQILRPNFIIIDSFLIFKRPFLDMLHDPDTLRHIITQVLQAEDGNYAPLSKQEELLEGSGHDRDVKALGFRKIKAGRKLMPRFWNYDPGHEIPEYITVRRPKNSGSGGSFPENKTMLLFAEDFLDYAESMPGTYEVLDISDYLLTLTAVGER